MYGLISYAIHYRKTICTVRAFNHYLICGYMILLIKRVICFSWIEMTQYASFLKRPHWMTESTAVFKRKVGNFSKNRMFDHAECSSLHLNIRKQSLLTEPYSTYVHLWFIHAVEKMATVSSRKGSRLDRIGMGVRRIKYKFCNRPFCWIYPPFPMSKRDVQTCNFQKRPLQELQTRSRMEINGRINCYSQLHFFCHFLKPKIIYRNTLRIIFVFP